MTNRVCPVGHFFTEANTYTDPAGRKHCRECGRKANRDSYHRKKAERQAQRQDQD